MSLNLLLLGPPQIELDDLSLEIESRKGLGLRLPRRTITHRNIFVAVVWAGWLKGLPVESVADEIERNLDILTAQHQNVSARHRSMRVVLEQSWNLLEETKQAVLKQLAVFRGLSPRN